MKQIAFLGIPGSNSFAAASVLPRVKPVGYPSFSRVFDAVISGECALGVLPIENTLSGSIYAVYDLLESGNLHIVGEVFVRIHHCLITRRDAPSVEKFTRCLTHPEAEKQCTAFFRNFPNLNVEYCSDTATAVKKLMESSDGTTAAIGNKSAADFYGASVQFEHIEDHPDNLTRFLFVGKKLQTRGNKVSVLFSLVHKPGSLLKALAPCAQHSVNLTKIESRPVHGTPWEYIFFADIESQDNKKLMNALSEMKTGTRSLTILGIYDGGKTYDA
jgi:3-deoxy-7-phosphoheptulonate synthase